MSNMQQRFFFNYGKLHCRTSGNVAQPSLSLKFILISVLNNVSAVSDLMDPLLMGFSGGGAYVQCSTVSSESQIPDRRTGGDPSGI